MDHHTRRHSKERNSIEEPDIRSALSKILGSQEFSRSKRAAEFLRFVVEEQLAGRGDRLKAFTIAREVYGRDESFDPRTDTIVRVEAGRLRSRLASYYETVGCDDPVRIDVPKGGYAPTFNVNSDIEAKAQLEAITSSSVSAGFAKRKALFPGSVIALMVIAVLAGWFFLIEEQQLPSGEDPKQTSNAFLAVLPLVTHSDDALTNRMAAGLVEAVITDLTKLSGVSVMAHASLLNLGSQSTDLGLIRREFGATHALRGSLERQGDLIRVNVQLIDISSSKTIWADRLDARMQELLVLQDVLTERIVNHLAVQISPQERALV